MKLPVLKYYLWVPIVTNFGLIGLAQEQQLAHDVVYYKIIEEIIAQDTIVPAWRARMIAGRVKNGTLSREDSTKYYEIIKNKQLLLFNKKTNLQARKTLNADLEDRRFLARHFSKEELKLIKDKIPLIDELFNEELLNDNIEIITEFPIWQNFHSFSSPIWFRDNLYLVYHFKASIGPTGFEEEFIVFSVDDCQTPCYVIEKRIITHMH